MYSTVFCLALLPLFSSFIFAQEKCCPNNVCYDIGLPWGDSIKRPVPPPDCSKDEVKYLLCNRSNPSNPLVFSTANFSLIQDYYDPSKPTVIVFHAWLGNQNSTGTRDIIRAYLTKVDANAIFVDYSNISMNIDYPQAVSDIRVAATSVSKNVTFLTSLGTSPSDIHLFGLSLGAHLAAYVAKAIPGIGRLTGLDPVGLLFTNQDCKVRFCPGDAKFQESIHTNGHPVSGIGTSQQDADVDFWVNGGYDQPKCGITVNPSAFFQINSSMTFQEKLALVICSHFRSELVYIEALTSNCTFWGVTPNETTLAESRLTLGFKTKYIVNTQGCTLKKCVPIGLQTINATRRGNFIVPTNYDPPFCGVFPVSEP